MLKLARRIQQSASRFFPVRGFSFDRPLVLLESDDWGRVGVRDQEGLEQLRAAGLALGERAYDFYTLETADDVAALSGLLRRHRDSTGRSPCLVMNFLLANVDFQRTAAAGFRQIHLRPLAQGLPGTWQRPGLFESYHEGVAAGVFYPALHGLTHFCRPAVERCLAEDGERAALLRTLWQAQTPYIHWRMPWIGYEYWDPEAKLEERSLPAEAQMELVRQAAETFPQLFSTPPRSACAPGYRAGPETHAAWARCGVRVAQNGAGSATAPHLGEHGILNLSRSMDFEPAVDSGFSVKDCARRAEECFARGVPAVVSVHSINFHSTLRDFRGPTLRFLDQFLGALEARHPDLLYLHDADLYELVTGGKYETSGGTVAVNVKQQRASLSRTVAEESR